MTFKVVQMIIFHDSLSNPTLPFCLVLISAPVILAFICCYLFVSFCVIVCLSFFFTGCFFLRYLHITQFPLFSRLKEDLITAFPQGILNPFTFKINLALKLFIICFIMYYFPFPLLIASSSRKKKCTTNSNMHYNMKAHPSNRNTQS